MSKQISFIFNPPYPLISSIVEDLKDIDIREVKAVSSSSLEDTIKQSIEMSDEVFVLHYKGVPYGLGGYTRRKTQARIWAVSSPYIEEVPLRVQRLSQSILFSRLRNKGVDVVYNCVPAFSVNNIKWLRYMGYTLVKDKLEWETGNGLLDVYPFHKYI